MFGIKKLLQRIEDLERHVGGDIPKAANRSTPACLLFDDMQDTGEFGRQVAMLLAMDFGSFQVDPSLRRWYHPTVGLLRFDDADQLQHERGVLRYECALAEPGRQRSLTAGDRAAIVEAMRKGLLSAVDVPSSQPWVSSPAVPLPQVVFAPPHPFPTVLSEETCKLNK